MKAAYIDSSFLIAIRFDEPGWEEMSRRLATLDHRFSSGLLEAEVLSALSRERKSEDGLLDLMTWVHPDRSLRPEISRVLGVGYRRGADVWHLANALYIAESNSELGFLTQDVRQREIAAELGFPVD